MFKMFLKLVIFILGYSSTTIADKASIVFDSPSQQVEYVFNVSEVHLTWYYKVSGISNLPTVKLFAEINRHYHRLFIIIGTKIHYLDNSPYYNRITANRSMSFASVKIKNIIPNDYTKYQLTIGDADLQEDVKSVKTLRKGVRPTKPLITCKGAQEDLTNLTVREGNDLECSCSSTGLPSPNVFWEFFGGKSNDSILKKEKISRIDPNIYTCVAINKYGLYNRSVLDLQVQYPPNISKVTSSSKSSYISQEVTFTCAADGNPLPLFFWKTPDNQTLTGSTLVVKLQSSREFGVYACITNNIHGKSTKNITLQQLFVPGKLRFVSNTSEAFKITTTWKKPEDNGGSSIISYFIRVSHKVWVIKEAVMRKLQYTVRSNLERNTTYTFCAWAENVVGNGSETCVNRSTLYEGEPNIPEKPTVRLVDGVLLVTWNKVIGSPSYYFVKYKRRDEIQWLRSGEISDLSELKYEIYNVVPGETYNVRIVAENKHGIKEGEITSTYVPTEKASTTLKSTAATTSRVNSSSTDKPILGEASDDGVSSTIIIISVLLVLLVIVAVIVLVLWLKHRSPGNSRNQREVEHLAGPMGDLYAVVEGKTKKEKNDRKDLVYAELSDFDPKASNSKPPETHHTEYADIAHILKEPDNDYEDIPPRSAEGDYANIKEVKRSNSIAV